MLNRLWLVMLLNLVLLLPAVAADKVNINTASASEIADVLEGIGPKKSAAIVTYRKANGAFEQPKDITKISGIGKKLFERNRDKIIVASSSDSSSDVETKSSKDSNAKGENKASSKPVTDKKSNTSTSKPKDESTTSDEASKKSSDTQSSTTKSDTTQSSSDKE